MTYLESSIARGKAVQNLMGWCSSWCLFLSLLFCPSPFCPFLPSFQEHMVNTTEQRTSFPGQVLLKLFQAICYPQPSHKRDCRWRFFRHEWHVWVSPTGKETWILCFLPLLGMPPFFSVRSEITFLFQDPDKMASPLGTPLLPCGRLSSLIHHGLASVNTQTSWAQRLINLAIYLLVWV